MIEELAARAESLAPHFKPDFLPRDHAVFQFEFDQGAPFYLEVDNQAFEFARGQHPAPTIELHISDHETCWGLLQGHIDGMHAFMDGRYRANGNIVLSQLLLYLFKSHDPTIAYEIQY